MRPSRISNSSKPLGSEHRAKLSEITRTQYALGLRDRRKGVKPKPEALANQAEGQRRAAAKRMGISFEQWKQNKALARERRLARPSRPKTEPDVIARRRAMKRLVVTLRRVRTIKKIAALTGKRPSKKSSGYCTYHDRVLRRDRHSCVDCGKTGRVHVHHILPWALFPELRADARNLVTVCRQCHDIRHGRLQIEDRGKQWIADPPAWAAPAVARFLASGRDRGVPP